MTRRAVILMLAPVLVWVGEQPAQAARSLIPPVDAAVARAFDPPAGAYGPGHRGIDLAAAAGSRVRAAGEGVVAFAGVVADHVAISIDHGAGVVTTYSRLAQAWVDEGDRVVAGTWLGTVADAHDGVRGLHFGVKVRGVYVDPSLHFGALDLGAALRLTPLIWQPSEDVPSALAEALAPTGPGVADTGCTATSTRSHIRTPPNDNVAIAIAGIGSKTAGVDAADMYEPGPALFGYPSERTYFFSYRGHRGPRLHDDYERTDTYGDITAAARRLGALVEAIGRRHPGAGVDLIAHSQGGVVARTYLEQRAAGRGGGPVVEHLVTFASPHSGAPVAANVATLRHGTLWGDAVLDAAGALSRTGAPVPDPSSPAVRQLAPGSPLMSRLDAHDVTFGTRILNLGIVNDLVVPADRTGMPRGLHRIVAPRGARLLPPGLPSPGNGHSAIVTSPEARAVVHDFLRGPYRACPTSWDPFGRVIGRAVSWAEGRLGAAASFLEGPLAPALRSLHGSRIAPGG